MYMCVCMNTSFAQGQEVVADHALEVASKEGHWVILQVSCHMYVL